MARKNDTDELAKALAEERINNAKLDERPLIEQGMDEEETVADMLSHVPADQGFYLKIYKKFPVPKEYGNRPMFLLDIAQPDLITDLEVELLKLARQYGWSDGIYEVKLFKHGEPGIQASRRVTLQVPILAQPQQPQPGQQLPPVDPLAPLAQAMKLIKEFQQPQGQQTDPSAAIRAVSEAYRAGFETAAKAPATPAGDTTLAIVRAVKEMIPAPVAAPQAPDLLGLIKEVGAFLNKQQPAQQPSDPIDLLIKLKQAGLIPDGQPQVDGTTKALELIGQLMPLMQSMNGGGDGNVSPVTELIRVIGPQVGKVISDVTGTINTIVSAKGAPRGARVTPPTQPMPTAPATEPKAEIEAAPIAAAPPASPALPIFQAIQKAAETNDTAFYPQLDDLLSRVTLPEQYEQLVAGTLQPQAVLAQVAQWGGPFFTSTQAISYFDAFLVWLRALRANEIVAYCSKCDSELVFDSKQELEANPNCTQCNILLTVSSSEPAQS